MTIVLPQQATQRCFLFVLQLTSEVRFMSSDNDDSNNEQPEQSDDQQQPATPAQSGPGVPPITSAPQQGQPASAFVQPAQTIPDGDQRFVIRDAGTPYVVGLGHLGINPTQLRNDQDKAEKAKAEKDEGQDEDEDDKSEDEGQDKSEDDK